MLCGVRLVCGISAVTLADQARTLRVPALGCLAMVPVVLVLDRVLDLGGVLQLVIGGPLALLAYAAVALPSRLLLFKELLHHLDPRRKPRPVGTEV
jgi:hypothetical protein